MDVSPGITGYILEWRPDKGLGETRQARWADRRPGPAAQIRARQAPNNCNSVIGCSATLAP